MPHPLHLPVLPALLRRLAGPLLAQVALATLVGCSPEQAPPEPVRAVKLEQVGVAAVAEQGWLAGEVRARTESRLGPRVGGLLLERRVDVGQHVQAGQVLARLDARDPQLAAQAAAAQQRAAQTQTDLAAADFARYQGLHAQGFISAAELQRRQATLDAARANLDAARAQADVARHLAGDVQLVAPAAGVVTAVWAEPAQVLAAGTPVLSLAFDGPRDVSFSVPEDQLQRLQRNQRLQVQGWGALPAAVAQVREIAASADPLTRTFAVRAALPADAALPLGASLRVRWPAAGAVEPVLANLSVPQSALREHAGGSGVWRFDPQASVVRAQAVQVERLDGERAVIKSGLAVGDWVVVAGVHLLHDAQKVTRFSEKQSNTHAQLAQSAPESVASQAAKPAPSDALAR